MLHLIKRHPLEIRAHFEFTLVLTFAFPQRILQGLLPPGLILDTMSDHGFVAVAMVQTDHMRPTGLPEWMGRRFFLTGYRIFARYRTNAGQTLRGLRILRSETDSYIMATAGNLLTHYNYQHSRIVCTRQNQILSISVESHDGRGDLSIEADVDHEHGRLPAGSIFTDARDARKFAGPLPFTFDYEPETNSIVRIEGVREHWDPQLVNVDIKSLKFLESPPFNEAKPWFVSAFFIENIPYSWKPGVVEKLNPAASPTDTIAEST